MGPKDVIRKSMGIADFTVNSYLGDLTDEELRLVPVEGMQPIARQLGHLIVAERMFQEMVEPGSAPALPEGFEQAHSLKENLQDSSGYKTKDEYLALWKQQRDALQALLDRISDADLADTRDGKLPPWAPTVCDVLNMAGLHSLMHAGQFVAVRRKLNKPVTF